MNDEVIGEVPTDRTIDDDAMITPDWPLWRRVIFRFLIAYWFVQIAPWDWIAVIPGVGAALQWISIPNDWIVEFANKNVFHVRDVLVQPNGSGDTSFAWTELWLYLSFALTACIVWSVIDRKRLAYPRLEYWLRSLLRFYIAMAAVSYGIIKVFAMQMIFPSLSQLATPLGDFLPMRFSWLFIGYSTPYQMFGGFAELFAGLLLLWRRTVPLGLMVAAGAFANVVMLNLSYDVPVKLYSSHLFAACCILLMYDARRLIGFLVLNQASLGTTAWEPQLFLNWPRPLRITVKVVLVALIVGVPLVRTFSIKGTLAPKPTTLPFSIGVYDVTRFVLRGDSSSPSIRSANTRWRDVIIDSHQAGSAGTTSAALRQRYGRGYFSYSLDTSKRSIAFTVASPVPGGKGSSFTMHYVSPDSATAFTFNQLPEGGVIHLSNDSLQIDLRRTNRHFPLAERQFHWLSEYNR